MKRLYHIDFATLHNKHSDHLSNDVQSDETGYSPPHFQTY